MKKDHKDALKIIESNELIISEQAKILHSVTNDLNYMKNQNEALKLENTNLKMAILNMEREKEEQIKGLENRIQTEKLKESQYQSNSNKVS